MRDLASCVDKVKVILSVGLVRKKTWGDSKDHLYHLIHPTSITNLKPPYLTSVCPSEIYQGKTGMSILTRNYRTTVLRATGLLSILESMILLGQFCQWNTFCPKMNKLHDWLLTTIPHIVKTMPRTDEAAVHCLPKYPWITRIHNCLLIWKLLWQNL